MLAWVYAKFKAQTTELKIVISILFFLALFQVSEYGVCERLLFDSQIWGKIGFVSITLLPALGLHLIQAIRRDTSLRVAYFGYLLAALFSVAFVFFNTFDAIQCLGNYAIFEFGTSLGTAFALYYYALLGAGTVYAFNGWKSVTRSKDKQALVAIVYGYASFVLPGSFIHFVLDSEGNGLPSIMCGFAIIFAFILTFYVAPRVRRR